MQDPGLIAPYLHFIDARKIVPRCNWDLPSTVVPILEPYTPQVAAPCKRCDDEEMWQEFLEWKIAKFEDVEIHDPLVERIDYPTLTYSPIDED